MNEQVAPRAGAWIETKRYISATFAAQSLPARGRGLKPCVHREVAIVVGSLPARGRGLKLRGENR